MSTLKPDLTRVWASGAPGANVEDPDVTVPGKFDAGWEAEIPPFENFNFLQQLFTQGLAHNNEQGINSWDTDTTYPINGLAKGSDGDIYVALIEQNGNDPVGDGINWILAFRKTTESLSKNAIINGNFDIWQRATSQTSNGYGSDDRWRNENVGSTKVHSQQAFTIGQTDIPSNPTFYSRTVVTSIGGAGNYARKTQPIENVRKYAGKTITVSFRAKADAAKDIAIEGVQNFGTGGAPSAEVTAVDIVKKTLGVGWAQYSVTMDVPSIVGKTIGTDDNDYFELVFWFDAGSDFNARTDTLGQQSGTFEISEVQVEEGSVATNFESRTVEEELALCHRYFEKSYDVDIDPGAIAQDGKNTRAVHGASTVPGIEILFKVRKRGAPAVIGYSPQTGAAGFLRNETLNIDVSITGFANSCEQHTGQLTVSGVITDNHRVAFHYAADSEL